MPTPTTIIRAERKDEFLCMRCGPKKYHAHFAFGEGPQTALELAAYPTKVLQVEIAGNQLSEFEHEVACSELVMREILGEKIEPLEEVNRIDAIYLADEHDRKVAGRPSFKSVALGEVKND